MLQRYMIKPLWSTFLSVFFLSALASYNQPSPSNQAIPPGVSVEPSTNQPTRDTYPQTYPSQDGQTSDQLQNNRSQATGKEEIVQGDSRTGSNTSKRHIRMGSWDHKSNWRYHREAYLKGQTQPEVYRNLHPSGTGGVGYDMDKNYKKQQELKKANQASQYAKNENQTKNNTLTNSSKTGNSPNNQKNVNSSQNRQPNATAYSNAYNNTSQQGNDNNRSFYQGDAHHSLVSDNFSYPYQDNFSHQNQDTYYYNRNR